jgi:hypothetical protein
LRLCDARNGDICPARLYFVIALLLIPTDVWTGNQLVQAFIDCHADGKTCPSLFDSRHGQEIFLFSIESPLPLQPTWPQPSSVGIGVSPQRSRYPFTSIWSWG